MFQEVIQVKQVNHGRYSTATIERSYEYFVYGRMGNCFVAIASNNKPIPNFRTVEVLESARRPSWKVEMDRRMGKSYNDKETFCTRFRFNPITTAGICNRHVYILYELL